MDVIIVVANVGQRNFKAWVEDRPAEYERGEFREAAVGNLVCALVKDFGAPITIVEIKHQ